MRLLVCSFILLGFATAGCGGNPTQATPVVTPVTLTSSATEFYLGQTYTFSAGGATITSWSSDAPLVATVASGQVTIVGVGDADIIASGPTAYGTQRITSYPNFQGAWNGSYVVNGCSDSGGLTQAHFCDSPFTPGHVLPVQFNLTQDRTGVFGTVSTGSIASDNFTAPTSGTTAHIVATAAAGSYQQTMNWTLNQNAGAGQLQGTGFIELRNPCCSGVVHINVTLNSVTRQGSSPHPILGAMRNVARPQDLVRGWLTP
jgi:hypothetical protein